jgi:acyl-CoA reductase-like NAD-dependent aldehyde dehydrogenase
VIGGAQVPAATGATLDTVNPGTGRMIGTLPAGDAQDIDRAVAAARQRFESGQWRDMKPAERKKRLLALADRLEAAAEEFAVLETIDPASRSATPAMSTCPSRWAPCAFTPRRWTRSMARSAPPARTSCPMPCTIRWA